MALTKVKLNTMVTGNLPDANIPNNITIDTASAAPASGLTGNTLASGVTASSLTSVGTLSSLTVSGDVTIPEYIKHTGDTDTFIRFTDNKINFVSGIATALELGGTVTGNTIRGTNTFEGNVTINTSSHSTLLIKGADGCDAELALQSDDADDDTDYWSINAKHSTGGTLHFATYGSGSWTNPLVLAHNLATFGTNVQVPNGYQLQWGGTNNAIFGHHTNNYITMKTNGTDRFEIDEYGTVDHKAGRYKLGGHWMFEEVSDQKVRIGEGMNNGIEIFQDMEWYGEGKAKIEDTAGSASTPTYSFNSDTDTGMYRGAADTLRFATGGTERIEVTNSQIKATGNLINVGYAETRITSNNTGHDFKLNADTNYVNSIDSFFDGASAASSFMRIKAASGAGTQNTVLTMYGDGSARCEGNFTSAGGVVDGDSGLKTQQAEFKRLSSQSFSNGNLHDLTQVHQRPFIVKIEDSAGGLSTMGFPIGGSGIAYNWSMFDSDSNTWFSNQATITSTGTSGNTYHFSFNTGSGVMRVQRTNGSLSFTVRVYQIAE